METKGSLEFVNRGAELGFLASCLSQPRSFPSLVVIRSPAGFGKSRLTEQLEARYLIPGLKVCIVDPSIRARVGSARLHDGFFLQRCAEELSAIADIQQVGWPAFGSFLRSRGWKTALEKKSTDAISELPSLGHAYRVTLDYAARLFGLGRFSPGQLLASDQSDAVRLCSEYVEKILAENSIVLVIREVQHTDLDSLRSLLQFNQRMSGAHLILEYTSEAGQFEPEHQKLFLRAAENHKNFHILDLFRLEPDHLEYLIRNSIQSDFNLTSDFYLTWNGNLRSIEELKFQVAIGRNIVNASQIRYALGNLTQTLDEHINILSSLDRLILAMVWAHIEAIDRTTLMQVIASVDPRTTPNALNLAFKNLISVHGFLTESNGALRIQNETIANSLSDAPSIRPFVAIAEKSLRDHYSQLVTKAEYGGVGISSAVRQLFRLCARTRDAVGLMHATEALSVEVRRSQDQAVYVDIVATAIEANPVLYAEDYDELIIWSAALAYDVCDWTRCSNLLNLRKVQDSFSRAMHACALQEIGKHDDALALASEIEAHATHSDEQLVADLIEAIVVGCRGQHEDARRNLNRIVDDPVNQSSPLLGYAYRLFEVVDEFSESLDKLHASISWFDRFGFTKSKAYSQLPAAVLMARAGNIDGARALIAEAERILADEVRDQHIVLNDRVVIEMLSDCPDFKSCCEMLFVALRYARDDFSELTILTNLSLAYMGMAETSAAIDCMDKAFGILRHHDFVDKEIYWHVCFNASYIFSLAGLSERSKEALDFPRKYGRPVLANRGYWAYRYGEAAHLEERYRFLASRPFHPLYLSHWLIDLDGLSLLKKVRLQ